MNIQIVPKGRGDLSEKGEYVTVKACQHPHDATLTLTTIERVIEKTVRKHPKESPWHTKTLVCDQPMTWDAALGFATRYAERKQIPVIYTAVDA